MPRRQGLWLLLLALVSAGCDAGKETHSVTQSEFIVAGSGVAPRARRGLDPATALATGRNVFQTRCAICHGGTGEGRRGQGPSVSARTFLEAVSDDMLHRWISDGRSGTTMIAWRNVLSPVEIDSVVAYVRGLTPHESVELDETPLTGDHELGAKLYRSICANCHGRTGSGYQESSNGTGIGRKAFLDVATDGYIRHVVNHGKSQTAMRGFSADNPVAVANLEPQEIDSVIRHLRHRAW